MTNEDAKPKEPWQIVNENAADIMRRSQEDLETFARTEPRMCAEKLRRLANNDLELRWSLHSEAWSDWHRTRAVWLDTYNAAITGLLAARSAQRWSYTPGALHENATDVANNAHGELPPKPEK